MDGSGFDQETGIELVFAEDLTFADVAPILDAFNEAAVFRVRADRSAWSGPASGGPEVAMILSTAAAVGGAAFVGTLCNELAKDVYKAARTGLLGAVRRLRAQDQRRAVVGLSIQDRHVRVCFGHALDDGASEDEWTDAWLVERLVIAQGLVDRAGTDERKKPEYVGPDSDCDHWLK
ncbi:MAG: hypothetical protein WEG56_12820 [Chloroflexota bacterium]